MKIIYLLWSDRTLSFVYKFLIFTPLITAVMHDAQLIGGDLISSLNQLLED